MNSNDNISISNGQPNASQSTLRQSISDDDSRREIQNPIAATLVRSNVCLQSRAQTTGVKLHNKYQKQGNNKIKSKANSSFSGEQLAVPLKRNFDRILKKNSVESDFGTTAFFNSKPRKLLNDVFNRVDRIERPSGLAFLKNRLNSQIKVIIRRRRNCPFISRVIEYKGILNMFDKHMNLYMSDVIESFTYKMDEKLIKRARHRYNIFLRGDNIILVS